jgi:outer membrane protein TolC
MKKITALFITLLSLTDAWSQANSIDRYIQTALESNIALQQQELSYEQSLAAMEEARAMFFPKLSLEARYSVARGGRAFEIPVGDLVNPIYSNLNIINSLGQAASPDYPVIPTYPTIPNVQENFLRETEHETTLRVVFPLFNSAILQNHKIRQNMAAADRISVDVYRRELVKEVKTAYFNYAKAAEAVTLFENALELVEENLRATESLYNNHKITIDVVYSAGAEVAGVKQQLAEARKNTNMARAYFNFLLNQPYDTAIEATPDINIGDYAAGETEARREAVQQREELKQLNHYLSVSDNQVQLSKGAWLPQVNLVADYGFQGTRYRFSRDDDFAMGSIVMSWNLFDHTTNKKVQQAEIEKLKMQKQKEELQQQIGLQVTNAYYDLEAGRQQVLLAQAELEAAQKAFRLVQKKYTQGQANLVEFTNARTQQTNAGQKLIIAKYDYQVKLAALERATASYKF